ncbi:siderophore-interacting protein [Amycolatopsis deserti]|uniref:Siderophore-interacting protein n=1 Tax=Amycolatopsis deserti TaxID=185696 RepID=A0ABQ3IAZ8_9PSEU|nr:helix-turn-helix domain-containing protein [Amycolatopsis deserti]GHE76325.1 siderophore-interacting protein [Amycolatopsis deserti]
MGKLEMPPRPVIALSWKRATLSGLEPGSPVDNFSVEEVDRRSRLAVAAGPVLDEMARQLEGTGFSVVLADRCARIVDLRFGTPALRPRMEKVGAVAGRVFSESTTGTNSIATTHEVRAGVAVHGEEHFIESLKKFSCYGHPIIDSVTRRLAGVLDITCLAEHENPLLAPFLVRAAKDIEQRLLAGAREAEQRMLAGYQAAVLRDRSRPVVALSEDLVLANAAATELLDAADHAVLRGLAVDPPAHARRLQLSGGAEMLVSVERVADGAVFTFQPVEPRVGVPGCRRTNAPVLVHGEPGSGLTRTALSLVDEASVFDASEVSGVGAEAWLGSVSRALASARAVVIEAVHLLPAAMARRVALAIPSARARIVLTSAPASDLHAEHASLVAHCSERIALAPLRQRRDDIPMLVRSMMTELGAARELRFTPAALEALATHSWPGNLRELNAVVRQVVQVREVGDVSVHDLPQAYRGRARTRVLTPIEQAEREAIVEALRVTGGNKKDAAQRLGISRTTLYNSIRVFGIVTPVSRT